MAPDSRLWRHQLGEAPDSFQRLLLKATLPFFLFATMSIMQPAEARTTDPVKDTWSTLSADSSAYERPVQMPPIALASLSPPSELINSSPVGRWSGRIEIPIYDQPAVQKYIRFYKGEGRKVIENALERSKPYLPVMVDVLESHGVPVEMLAVALVESSFKGHASYRGAGGYWQMLAGTARKMGLRVDRWVDERRDPVKSTQAAAKYLRSNYEQFNSWPLALAAYNAGGGVVACAVRRCRADDFSQLSRRGGLPSSTANYVAKVVAAVHILRDLEAYGFKTPKSSLVYDFESVRVPSPLKLQQVARWIDVPVSRLQELNPSLRLDCLPPDGGVSLNLPSGTRDRFDLAYEGRSFN